MSEGAYMLERIRSKCTDDGGCWVWNGFCNRGVFPVISVKSVPHGARRVAWQAATGRTVPAGFEIVAKCGTPKCVNPEHAARISMADRRREMAQLRDAASNSAATASLRAKGKLSMEKAREIRSSSETCTALAARFGVSHQVVSMVRLGRSWVEATPFTGLGARR